MIPVLEGHHAKVFPGEARDAEALDSVSVYAEKYRQFGDEGHDLSLWQIGKTLEHR